MPRSLPVLTCLLVLAHPAASQGGKVAGPVPSRVVILAPSPATPRLAAVSGLPLTGMAIGAGVLGIPILLCAIDGEPDGDFFDCNLRSILAAAVTGALLGGLVEGLVSPAQPRDTTSAQTLPAAIRRDLRQRTSLASRVPWAGLAIGGALGWGLVNAFCDTENPDDTCGGEKLQAAALFAVIGGTVQLFLR